MSLHAFGLMGVSKPSYYEAHGGEFHAAAAAFDLKVKLLEKAPMLSMMLASDPENVGQAVAKQEIQNILAAAMEIKGTEPVGNRVGDAE